MIFSTVTSLTNIIYNNNMKKLPLLLLILIFIPQIYAETLKVAAVQLEISDLTYQSYKNYKEEMESNVLQAIENFDPDLIIFPEYTSVFPAVTPYLKYIGNSNSIEEIFSKIRGDKTHIQSINDLFRAESEHIEKLMDFWGELSEKYSVTIVGGTYFSFQGDELTNRLIVFGPGGNRIYEQDKYFLTEFETDILNLSPGSSIQPEGLIIKGKKIAFTICRDTFLERWESMYSGVDLWIDIKANGVLFDDSQRALFSRALPARLKNTDAEYGVTVCLTGQFLELFWEGESSMIKKVNGKVHKFITSDYCRSNEILYFIVD